MPGVQLTLAIAAHQATVRITRGNCLSPGFSAGLDTDCISFIIEVVAA
jgi:hypothetical protein